MDKKEKYIRSIYEFNVKDTPAEFQNILFKLMKESDTVITNRQAYDYYRCWLLTRAVFKGENPPGCRYVYADTDSIKIDAKEIDGEGAEGTYTFRRLEVL